MQPDPVPAGRSGIGSHRVSKRVRRCANRRGKNLLFCRDFLGYWYVMPRNQPSTAKKTISMDTADKKILAVLQKDGRSSLAEIAAQVGLSPSPCLRRIRLLEKAGVIDRYV